MPPRKIYNFQLSSLLEELFPEKKEQQREEQLRMTLEDKVRDELRREFMTVVSQEIERPDNDSDSEEDNPPTSFNYAISSNDTTIHRPSQNDFENTCLDVLAFLFPLGLTVGVGILSYYLVLPGLGKICYYL